MNAIVFIPTGEVRPPKMGEAFETYQGTLMIADMDYQHVAFPIYTRHEIEATPDVLRALGMEGK